LADARGHPRRTIGAAADHHRVGTRYPQRCARCFRIDDVAVDDDGNAYGILHATRECPVGAALEELVAGARVHRDEANAGGFGTARQFRRVAAGIVPAQTHLQRDGHLDGADGRLDQAERVVEVAHQRRAGQLARHLARRASHVDVNNVGAEPFGNTRALRHPACVASCELYNEGRELPALGAAMGIMPRAHQVLACHHLGYDEAGAEPMHDPAERKVGHARHRREQHRRT